MAIFTRNDPKKKLFSSIYDNLTQNTVIAQTPPPGAIGQTASGGFIMPKTTTTQTPSAQQPLSAMDKMAQDLNSQANTIKQYYENRRLADEERKNKQIQEAQNAIKATEQSQASGIKDLEGQTANLIAEEEQRVGQEQRQQARSAQDARKILQNQFAALGTLEGSQYGQEATALEQDLANRQANERATAGRNISGYKLSLNEAKRSFINTVAQERANLQARISQIEDTFGKGTAEYDKAIRDAIFGAQNEINKANVEVEKAKQIEQIKNQSSQAASGQAENKQKALNMVRNVLRGNTAGISGAVRSGNVPFVNQWTGSGQTQADWEGLKSLLTLAARGQLKGSGAVSDFETRMLEKAAVAGIDPTKMSNDEFRRRLQQLETNLSGGGYGGQIITAPDGTQIEIID